MLSKLTLPIRNSFPGKIIALVVLTVIATSFIVGLVTTRSTRAFLTERTSEKFPSVLANSQSRVLLWFERQVGELDRLCQSPVFRENLARTLKAASDGNPSPSRTEIQRYLSLVLSKFTTYDELLVVDTSGNAVVSATGQLEYDAERLQFFDSEAGGFSPAMPDSAGRIRQWISIPVRDEQGVTCARLLACYDLTALSDLISDVSIGAHGDMYLVDSQGRFLTRPRAAENGVLWSVAMQVPTRQIGPVVVDKRSNWQGREVFHSKAHLERMNWWLVYEEEYAAAMSPVISAQRRIWVAVLIIGSISILIALRIANSILRPINGLALGARRINEGLVGVNIPSGGDDEIGLMITTFNDMAKKIALSQAELQYKNKMLNSQNDQLQEMNLRLEELSITDGLTGLFNHRHFWNLLNTELTRVDLYQGDLALVLVDLDDFKRVNDQFGHTIGDLLLQALSRVLKGTVRDTDIVARYGGEEFAILLPDTDRDGVQQVSEKTRESVESMRFKVPDTDITLGVTVSVGVSVFRGNRREFFNAADRALYRSKSEGKNCVHYALNYAE